MPEDRGVPSLTLSLGTPPSLICSSSIAVAFVLRGKAQAVQSRRAVVRRRRA
jgi:hypothetical protein